MVGVPRIEQELYRLSINIQVEIDQVISNIDRHLIRSVDCILGTESQCSLLEIDAPLDQNKYVRGSLFGERIEKGADLG